MFSIDIGNPFADCHDMTPSGYPPTPESSDSSIVVINQKNSTTLDRTVAFFTKGVIGKGIVSQAHLIGRQIVGGMAGRWALAAFGSSAGRVAGYAAVPAFATVLFTALAHNSSEQTKLGVSKSVLATGIAVTALALQILCGQYFEDCGEVMGNYLLGGLGALAGDMLLAYITAPPELSMEEYAKQYVLYNGVSTLTGALLPSAGIFNSIRDSLAFTAMYNAEAIRNTYAKASNTIAFLKDHDIAQLAQNHIAESGQLSFMGASLLINQLARFIRVGMRSFNEYSTLASDSFKINAAQKKLLEAFTSLDDTAIANAKKDLLNIIKKEMKQKFWSVGVADSITKRAFERFLAPQLDIEIANMEEYLLGFTVTDEANEAYSKALLQIHGRCFLAFASVHFLHKNPLSKDEQVLFFHNIAQVFMSHYQRVAPDSTIVQYVDSTVHALIDQSASIALSIPSETEEPLFLEETPIVSNDPPTEAQKGRIKLAVIFMVSMMTALCRYLRSLFTSSTLPRETASQIIQDTVQDVWTLVNNPNEIEEDFEETTTQITELPEDAEEEFFTPPETEEELEDLLFEDAIDDEALLEQMRARSLFLSL